ncbi:MAG: hypothetical protein MUE53_02080 [Chitinophagales bacterium]|jgi:shikimate dehydrogenase|nr:hypothetical protein [Chitinophagales bacterium]
MSLNFGLIGRDISYSKSKELFEHYFSSDAYRYELIDIPNEKTLYQIWPELKKSFRGINVTIPYKSSVLGLLQEVEDQAKHVQSVNTILFEPNGALGINTDFHGFDLAFVQPYLMNKRQNIKEVLILGNGATARMIKHSFTINFPYARVRLVGRSGTFDLSIAQLSTEITQTLDVLINATPTGTINYSVSQYFPFEEFCYKSSLQVFDVVYQPENTPFVSFFRSRGHKAVSGLEMLKYQAIAAYRFWGIYPK